MLDLIAGYISVESEFLENHIKREGNSEWADIFSPMGSGKIYNDGTIKIKVEELVTMITYTFTNKQKKIH